MTVTSCFVYKDIRDLKSIDHLCIHCIHPIHRIGLIHKRSIDSRKVKWGVQVNVLLNNCKHYIMPLSLFIGTTVEIYFGAKLKNIKSLFIKFSAGAFFRILETIFFSTISSMVSIHDDHMGYVDRPLSVMTSHHLLPSCTQIGVMPNEESSIISRQNSIYGHHFNKEHYDQC